jgi:microcystin-dependent protein
MAEPFLSEIRLFSFAFTPRGWAQCNGQLLPINQNQALFALLGTTFGGDGRVNFALPDFRGRAPLHVGGGHTLGERGGEQAHTLSPAEVPSHSHPAPATGTPATTGSPAGAAFAVTDPATAGAIYSAPGAPTPMAPTASTGGSQAHLNMQPFLTISFCIALQGIFPSPN